MKTQYSVLVYFILLLSPNFSCADGWQLGPNYFAAGLPTGMVEILSAPEVEGRQRQENWCWAACVQMVLNCHGLGVTQEQVVQRIYGAQIDAPADFQQILIALSGWTPDCMGRPRQILVNIRNLEDGRIIDDLQKNCPRIIGVRNFDSPIDHACVLTAVEFHLIGPNNPYIDRYILRDPAPAGESMRVMSREEFAARSKFNIGVYVSP